MRKIRTIGMTMRTMRTTSTGRTSRTGRTKDEQEVAVEDVGVPVDTEDLVQFEPGARIDYMFSNQFYSPLCCP